MNYPKNVKEIIVVFFFKYGNELFETEQNGTVFLSKL